MDGKKSSHKQLEWAGVVTAIAYSLLVAANIGAEVLGFCLLLLSACLIGAWAYLEQHRGMLLLQFFYLSAAIFGIARWL